MRHASLAIVTLQFMSFGCEQRVPVPAVPSPASAAQTEPNAPDAAPNDNADAWVAVPRVIPGKPDLVGPADEGDVRAQMRVDGRREFTVCFDKALQGTPHLHGRVVFSFTINPDGSVASPTVRESSLNHPEAEACMVERLAGIRFPAVTEPVEVTFPFTFEIGDEHTH